MNPLFQSGAPRPKHPHLCWHIYNLNEFIGQPMLLCGRPIGLNTHRVGRRTWPCLNDFPALGRECPHCDRAVRFTTWVPLMPTKRPYKLVVIMGGQTTWDSVEFLKPGQVVEGHWARTLKPTPMFKREVTQLGVGQLNEAAKEEVPLKGDLTRWLLHYWQWPALSQWFGEVYRESVKVKNARERAELHGMSTLGVKSFGTGA